MYGESDADPSNPGRALTSAQLIALCTALKHVCSLKKLHSMHLSSTVNGHFRFVHVILLVQPFVLMVA